MATLAAFFRRADAGVLAAVSPREHWHEQRPDPSRLRPLPYEDVYFFSKRIDNSRVVREADPAAGRKCWRMVSLSVAAALVLMGLLLPNALGMIAGYQVHALQAERQQLLADRSRLDLEEAALLSPERLQELARTLEMVDPGPDRVLYLNPQGEASAALSVPGGK